MIAWITIGGGREESDLVQVDATGGEAGLQAPQVQLETDRGLADPGRAAQQQDPPAGTVGRAGRTCGLDARRLAGHLAEAGPVPAAVPDQPGRLGSRHAGRVHAHVGESAGIHPVALRPHLPQDGLGGAAAALVPAGQPPHDLAPVRAQPTHQHRCLLDQVPLHAQGQSNDAGDDHAPGACHPVVP